MSLFITEISKYIIFLLMCIYVAECFLSFRFRHDARQRGVNTRQLIWMFAIQALFYAQIIANTGELSYLGFYVAQLLILTATPVLFTRLFPAASRPLMNNMCMLLMIGMTVILRIDPAKARRQLVIVAGSIAAGCLLTWLVRLVRTPERYTWFYAGAGAVLLLIVRLLGATTFGAQISYTLLGVSGQPSEFVKILYVLFIAGALHASTSFLQVALTSGAAAAHVLILVWSRDLGGALIFFVVYVVLLYIATGNPLYPLAGLLLGSVFAVVAFRFFGHVRDRVMVWLDPFRTIDTSGYQITQSLFGISGGGWFGMGLFGGMPTATPIVEKDLIFSAIAEELGVGFAILLLLVCLSTFLIFLREAIDMEDMWTKLVTAGIGVTYLFQVFLTVGGTAKFIPLTGVTLPLVSYGGSSVLATILMFCIFEGLCNLRDRDAADPEEETTGRRIAIPVVCVFFALLFVSMSAFIGVHAYTDRRVLMSNSYNRRQELRMRSVERGRIYAADGTTLLAQTVLTEDGTQERVYPYGEIFAHAVGYAVKDKAGVEAYASFDLTSSHTNLADRIQLASDRILFPGDDVITTLDVTLQQTIYEAMGDYRGAVIVTDPRSGAILAMVSKPSFDPGAVDAMWEALTADEEGSVLVNRATQGLYPAGSTFKIITTLAYLRDHHNDIASYSYNCYGSFTTAGETVHCFNSIPHGTIDLAQSFALSCNSSFVNIGVETGRDLWKRTLDGLHFGGALPCDLVSNVSTCADPLHCDVPALMQLSIGQGETAMSPLHMNMITCAVANGGILMRPHILSEVVNVYGNTVQDFGGGRGERLMSEEEARILSALMEGVVTSGTGQALAGRYYTSAGKTGSAEHGSAAVDNAHAWFTGYAPADHPEICVTLILEDAGSSSSYAVPLAGIIFDAYFGSR
ncbi:MAG: FtsW/RodA/SpoVE family cell cycle protein [Lachnospiraceae bacterium]|nr:FtsW/RodA/SpoVE family cell cycle protein [Lachnospiraceae bacterium]